MNTPAPTIPPALSNRRVFVTGATGFVGAHVANALAQAGAKVVALARPGRDTAALEAMGATVAQGDLLDEASLRAAINGCEIVLHCAAVTSRTARRRADFQRMNVLGTEHVMRAAVAAGVRRVVYCSSSGVHGPLATLPAHEDAPLRPDTAYRRSKLEGERIVQRYIDGGQVEAVVARLTSVYGPGARNWVRLCRDLQQRRVRMIGAGDTPYHISHVDDVAAGLLCCAAHPAAAGRTYFVGGDSVAPVRDFFATVAAAAGVPFQPTTLPSLPFRLAAGVGHALLAPLGCEPKRLHAIDFFLRPRVYSLERIRCELGFVPRVPLAEGVQRTVAWYREQGWLEATSTPPAAAGATS